jgi:hypothetical protein
MQSLNLSQNQILASMHWLWVWTDSKPYADRDTHNTVCTTQQATHRARHGHTHRHMQPIALPQAHRHTGTQGTPATYPQGVGDAAAAAIVATQEPQGDSKGDVDLGQEGEEGEGEGRVPRLAKGGPAGQAGHRVHDPVPHAQATQGDVVPGLTLQGGSACGWVNVNVNELRLGFSNTTRSPEGLLSHNNRKS